MKRARVRELVEAMSEWYGILLTEEQAEAIAEAEPRFVSEADEMGVDTCIREWFVDLVGRHVGMKARWPLGLDGKDYAIAYFETFKEKCAQAGVKLREGWME